MSLKYQQFELRKTNGKMHLLRFETQFLTGNSCPHWGRQDQRVHRGQAGRHHRHLHHRRGGGDHRGGWPGARE